MPKDKTLPLVEAVEHLERISPNGVTFDVLKKFAVEVELRVARQIHEVLKGKQHGN